MFQFSARVELAVEIRCQVLRQPNCVCVCVYWCIHTTAFACVYVCVIFYVWMPVTTCVCVRFQTCTSSYRHSPPFFLPCSVAYLDVSKLTTAVCVCVLACFGVWHPHFRVCMFVWIAAKSLDNRMFVCVCVYVCWCINACVQPHLRTCMFVFLHVRNYIRMYEYTLIQM